MCWQKGEIHYYFFNLSELLVFCAAYRVLLCIKSTVRHSSCPYNKSFYKLELESNHLNIQRH